MGCHHRAPAPCRRHKPSPGTPEVKALTLESLRSHVRPWGPQLLVMTDWKRHAHTPSLHGVMTFGGSAGEAQQLRVCILAVLYVDDCDIYASRQWRRVLSAHSSPAGLPSPEGRTHGCAAVRCRWIPRSFLRPPSCFPCRCLAPRACLGTSRRQFRQLRRDQVVLHLMRKRLVLC